MAKTETKQKQIKATKVEKNLIVVIDNKKHVKANVTAKELESIKNKILIYNKANTEARLKEIKKLLENEGAKEKAKKEIAKKGVKAIIKKVSKTISKKKVSKVEAEPKDLLTSVRKAHADKRLTDEDIKSLQDLLAKAEEEKKTEPKAEERTSTYGRESYR